MWPGAPRRRNDRRRGGRSSARESAAERRSRQRAGTCSDDAFWAGGLVHRWTGSRERRAHSSRECKGGRPSASGAACSQAAAPLPVAPPVRGLSSCCGTTICKAMLTSNHHHHHHPQCSWRRSCSRFRWRRSQLLFACAPPRRRVDPCGSSSRAVATHPLRRHLRCRCRPLPTAQCARLQWPLRSWQNQPHPQPKRKSTSSSG